MTLTLFADCLWNSPLSNPSKKKNITSSHLHISRHGLGLSTSAVQTHSSAGTSFPPNCLQWCDNVWPQESSVSRCTGCFKASTLYTERMIHAVIFLSTGFDFYFHLSFFPPSFLQEDSQKFQPAHVQGSKDHHCGGMAFQQHNAFAVSWIATCCSIPHPFTVIELLF